MGIRKTIPPGNMVTHVFERFDRNPFSGVDPGD